MPYDGQVKGDARLALIDRATEMWGEDELQIDVDAKVLDNESDGYWVQAWVFVGYETDRTDLEAPNDTDSQ